ncbi:MAG: putative molybdenum carrier protein [Rivularia sp. (in: cyanobacteria)]
MLDTIFKTYSDKCHALFIDPSKFSVTIKFLKSKFVNYKHTRIIASSGYIKITCYNLASNLIAAFTKKFNATYAIYRIRKVISGGQSGADVAGLVAAERVGIPTGGTAPLGYKCCDSKTGKTVYKPEVLRDRFGLSESPSSSYQPRTWTNVTDADVTLIFGNTNSSGSKLTIKYCVEAKKPYLCNPTVEELTGWIQSNKPSVINVAGNREFVNPGIFKSTRDTLKEVFSKFK